MASVRHVMRLAFAVEVLLILSWSAIATADSELHDVSGTVLDLRHGPTEAPPTTPDLYAVHDAVVTERYPWQKPAAVDRMGAKATSQSPVTKSQNTDSQQVVDIERTMIDLSDQMELEDDEAAPSSRAETSSRVPSPSLSYLV